VAVAVAVAAVALAPPGRRLLVALAGGAYATTVGLVLMAGEAHRPADIVGAALVSTAVALAAVALDDPPAVTAAHPRPATCGGVGVLIGVGALAGLGLAGALWAVADAVAHGPLTGAEVDAARVLGFVAVGVASMAAVLGFAWLTRRVRLST
jgi:hypothetical protein